MSIWKKVARTSAFDLLKMSVVFVAATMLRLYCPILKLADYQWPMWRDPIDGLWRGPLNISHPKRVILSPKLTAIILSVAPLGILLAMQMFVQNVWDFNAAFMGALLAVDLLYVIIGGSISTTVKSVLLICSRSNVIALPLKVVYPWPRPFFLEVCRVSQGLVTHTWDQNHTQYIPMFFNLSQCAGLERMNRSNIVLNADRMRRDEIKYALDGFPSTTIGSAFAIGCFLALYLNAKLKAFSANRTPFWKHIAVASPLIGSAMIGKVRLRENVRSELSTSSQVSPGCIYLLIIYHSQATTPVILITSALLGTACGLIAYRSTYCAVFDYNQNHLPFDQGPDKPRPKLPLHTFHLAHAIHGHLAEGHTHGSHLHLPAILRHRSTEQKRQDDERRWLAVNLRLPEGMEWKIRRPKKMGRKWKDRMERARFWKGHGRSDQRAREEEANAVERGQAGSDIVAGENTTGEEEADAAEPEPAVATMTEGTVAGWMVM
ncbi:MAG: hypothetical protein Q9220_004228 [cf. Caloplaca sp. 1 TL-2023]